MEGLATAFRRPFLCVIDMADENTEKKSANYSPCEILAGRLPIYTSIERFDPENEGAIITEINEALSIHVRNLIAMEYLYWYRRGITPVLARHKDIRPEICNKINVNYADEIATFKGGYFMTQPCYYMTKREGREEQEKVKKLNEYLVRSGKQIADNKLVDWFDTVGKANLFVQANDDRRVPFKAYALDPRSAFVAKSMGPGERPVYSVHTVVNGDKLLLDVSDDTYTYTIAGTVTGKLTTPEPKYVCTAVNIIDRKPNTLGFVPIIEYYYNRVAMASFEAAIPLIDASSFLQSDRLDAVDQAVQSLLVFYNCELEDEDGKAASPKMIREAGALFLKSIGENKADLKEIVTNLDQSQTQVFIDNLRDQILAVSAMPNSNQKTGHNSATGNAALIMADWYMADTAARNTEDLFRESNAYFDEIILHILREKGLLDIEQTDIELQFVRNETANAQSKAQTFQTYMAGGLHPILALAKSGASNDPVADYEQSKDWIKLRWGDPEAMLMGEGEGAEADPMATAKDGQSANYGTNVGGGSGDGKSGEGRVNAYWQMRNGKRVLIDAYQKRVKPKTREEKPE